MMSALILAAAKALAMMSLITMLIVLVACAAWRLIYYGWGCRKNPIGKTAILSAAVLWLISAAVINLV